MNLCTMLFADEFTVDMNGNGMCMSTLTTVTVKGVKGGNNNERLKEKVDERSFLMSKKIIFMFVAIFSSYYII